MPNQTRRQQLLPGRRGYAGREKGSVLSNRALSAGDAVDRIDWIATLFQAARNTKIRARSPETSSPRFRLRYEHLRVTRSIDYARERHVIVLDCSASVVETGALALAKGWLLLHLRTLRRQQVEVVLICFGGGQAERRFGPAIPTGWNESWIEPIGGGGGTPLTLGMQEAAAAVSAVGMGGASERSRLILLSDGRTLETPDIPGGFAHIAVIDLEKQSLRLGRAAQLAERWGGHYVHVDELVL